MNLLQIIQEFRNSLNLTSFTEILLKIIIVMGTLNIILFLLNKLLDIIIWLNS